MRKLLILIFGTLIGLPALSQTTITESTRIWYGKRYNVQDGQTIRYLQFEGGDTARIYITGLDTFEVTTTFRKYSATKPKPPLPDIVSTVDDNVTTGPQAYSPAVNAGDNIYITNGWTHMKNQTWNAPHHDKTASFVDALTGAYIELTFTGYGVEWWTEKRNNHGIASIQVDGGNPIDVDLYDPRTDNNSLLVWSVNNLVNATHTLRVNYTGRKNTAATQTNILHDKFVIRKKQ